MQAKGVTTATGCDISGSVKHARTSAADIAAPLPTSLTHKCPVGPRWLEALDA